MISLLKVPITPLQLRRQYRNLSILKFPMLLRIFVSRFRLLILSILCLTRQFFRLDRARRSIGKPNPLQLAIFSLETW